MFNFSISPAHSFLGDDPGWHEPLPFDAGSKNHLVIHCISRHSGAADAHFDLRPSMRESRTSTKDRSYATRCRVCFDLDQRRQLRRTMVPYPRNHQGPAPDALHVRRAYRTHRLHNRIYDFLSEISALCALQSSGCRLAPTIITKLRDCKSEKTSFSFASSRMPPSPGIRIPDETDSKKIVYDQAHCSRSLVRRFAENIARQPCFSRRRETCAAA